MISQIPAWLWWLWAGCLLVAILTVAWWRVYRRPAPRHALARLDATPAALRESMSLECDWAWYDRPLFWTGGFSASPEAAWTREQLAELHDAPTVLDGLDLEWPKTFNDLGPRAGLDCAGYNSHLPSGGACQEDLAVKVDSVASDDLPPQDAGAPEPARVGMASTPEAAGAGGWGESESFGVTAPPALARRCPQCDCRLLLNDRPHCPRCGWCGSPASPWAELDEFMERMRTDHERWLAAARERWAA